MSARILVPDRETPMLFPPDLRDWVKDDSLAHFVIDSVEVLSLRSFAINHKGSGSYQYSPGMMLSLLIYSYATGRFSSRVIEESTYNDVAVRYICGGDMHPDHDTICKFRRENENAIKESFVKVLMMAGEIGVLNKVGGISVDGTKIKANASKHKAVSYKKAGQMIEKLEREIDELMKRAEDADRTSLDDGLSIPEEIVRREERKKKLEKAKKTIEERYILGKKKRQEEYDKQTDNWNEMKDSGKKVGRKPIKPREAETPPDGMQVNFTDAQSRIMKMSGSQHFEQSYNAQASVDTEGSMLILSSYVTNHANDKNELEPIVASVDDAARVVEYVRADTGYYSEYAVNKVENDGKGPKVYCAVGKEGHGYSLEKIEKANEEKFNEDDYTAREKMKLRLNTKAGRSRYKKRKETVEPVFGIVKSVMGFRSFRLRGLAMVNLEWNLVCLAYNMKRFHRIVMSSVA